MDFKTEAKHRNAPETSAKATLTGHQNSVDVVKFSPVSNSTLISGSFDKTYAIWDLNSSKLVKQVEAHVKGVWSIDWANDGKRFLTGSGDSTIKLWDASSYKEIAKYAGHKDHILCVKFRPDGGQIASASQDGTVNFWDPKSSKVLHSISTGASIMYGVEYTQDGKYIITSDSNGQITAFDASTFQKVAATKPIGKRAYNVSLDFSRDKGSSKTIFGSYEDCHFRSYKFNGSEFEIQHEEFAHTDTCKGVFANFSLNRLVSCSKDGGAKLWNLEDYSLLSTFVGFKDSTSYADFPKDGTTKIVAISGWDQTVRLFNIEY